MTERKQKIAEKKVAEKSKYNDIVPDSNQGDHVVGVLVTLNSTQEYYNKNAKEYFERTKNNVQFDLLNAFIGLIDKNEMILDLGCGSGNSLKIMKEMGHTVTGVDNASDLIEYARIFTNVEIYNLNMADVEKVNDFVRHLDVKHIFANASLTHLTKQEFIFFMDKIKIPLYFYFSLKEGKGESFDKSGRFFAHYTKEEIEKILNIRFDNLYFTLSKDRMKRKLKWLNWIVRLKR